jgi:D-glycero-D-manno-heptose 1,7-bisphosphate phosphatase
MKLVILDRDGVINYDSANFIKSPEDWKPIPGSLDAIARLNQSDYHVVVATNQSGIGRGLFDMTALNAIHDRMHKALMPYGGRIDAIFFCPHPEEVGCDCRKPKTGMLQEIAQRFNANLAGVPCIGDGLRDLLAASAVGARPILVLTGKGKKTRDAGGKPENTEIFSNLAEAVRSLTGSEQ